jgi:hypothetical protein
MGNSFRKVLAIRPLRQSKAKPGKKKEPQNVPGGE